MDLHRGRLLDHVQLVVRDLPAAERFYTAIAAGGRDNGAPGLRPIIRIITLPLCWTRMATISRWSITVRHDAVRLRFRYPSTSSRTPEPGGDGNSRLSAAGTHHADDHCPLQLAL